MLAAKKFSLILVNLWSIEIFVVCENILVLKNEKFDEILSAENRQDENLKNFRDPQGNEVLNSVYDAMKNNFNPKFNRIDLMSENRNRRNTNYVPNLNFEREPPYTDYDLNEVSLSSAGQFEKKADNHAKGYRQLGTRSPLYYKDSEDNKRYGHHGGYEEEYVKCHETRPSVHTIEVEHSAGHSGGHSKALLHESFYAIILVGLKYLLGGLLLLSLPFVIAKAVLIPLKFLVGLKIIALANTFLFGYYFFKFLKKWLRFHVRPALGASVHLPTHGLAFKSNKKLESIKQILNNDNYVDESDDEEESLEQDVVPETREDTEKTVENEYEEQLLRDLIKIIKKRNKNW